MPALERLHLQSKHDTAQNNLPPTSSSDCDLRFGTPPLPIGQAAEAAAPPIGFSTPCSSKVARGGSVPFTRQSVRGEPPCVPPPPSLSPAPEYWKPSDDQVVGNSSPSDPPSPRCHQPGTFSLFGRLPLYSLSPNATLVTSVLRRNVGSHRAGSLPRTPLCAPGAVLASTGSCMSFKSTQHGFVPSQL